jgi:hypothetical protein
MAEFSPWGRNNAIQELFKAYLCRRKRRRRPEAEVEVNLLAKVILSRNKGQSCKVANAMRGGSDTGAFCPFG